MCPPLLRSSWLLLLTSLLACSSDNRAVQVGGERSAVLHVPASYNASTPAPLVLSLHGYGGSAATQELFLGLTAESDRRGFLYVRPEGTKNTSGKRFWNATDACCNFGQAPVDDATYLAELIREVKSRYAVDPQRVYFFGYSNGGFMSHRMACEHSEDIAAIASLAGVTFADASRCTPSSPVSVLQIHGTADDVIAYGGGTLANLGAYPGAVATVDTWASLNRCDVAAATSEEPLDLDTRLAGAESTVTRYSSGCAKGTRVELWTMQGATHQPSLSKDFLPTVLDFLLAQRKSSSTP